MTFAVSPGVSTREIDLTGVISTTFGTATGFVGQFRWGPQGIAQLVTNEADLASQFLPPNDAITGVDFLLASSNLAYTNNLLISRVSATGCLNAAAPLVGHTATGYLVQNDNVFNSGLETFPVSDAFLARYSGSAANGLEVVIVDSAAEYAAADNGAPSNPITNPFATYRRLFPSAPGTSDYVAGRGGSNDEMHIAVIDVNGVFSGVQGTVLEIYPFVSKASDAFNDSGQTNYYVNVINNQSQFIYATNPDNGAAGLGAQTGMTIAQCLTSNSGVFTSSTNPIANVYTFELGADGSALQADLENAWNVYLSKEQVQVSLLIGGTADEILSQYIIQNVAEVRTDCVAFVSPPSTLVVGQTNFDTVAQNVATYRSITLGISSSYGFMDSGWKYMYDKYNDTYRWIPLNADIAGLCSYTDSVRDPWWSPAGFNRGAIRNVVRLAWSPNEAQRDVLYSVGVNPVVSFPNQGTILYGDKTLYAKSSVFSRINVRRLFIVLEKLISNAAQASLFEFNDEFTQAQFIALVTPFLRDVQGRRGIVDFQVVCDSTNNTPQVINANQFKGDIYVIPNQSINFIQLTFVAVNNGVSFSTVVGQAG